LTDLNPESLTVLTGCKVESTLASAPVGKRFQYDRHGYISGKPDSQPAAPVLNRTVTHKDTWARISGKAGK
jgi:glutaminyl-tRNA synthetase